MGIVVNSKRHSKNIIEIYTYSLLLTKTIVQLRWLMATFIFTLNDTSLKTVQIKEVKKIETSM